MKTKRQPIVVVLGHVDHGKTSLLDALRNTNVTAGEAGGITQSIGASVVTFINEVGQNKSICFIDTPGHAIFSGMRSRGSKLADIALLIIDGSSGVKPQTKEAISLIREANIPFIVVVTKTDLPSASIDVVLGDLEKEGISFEGRGGQTPYIGVSAKKKEKLTELIELINLLSEVNEIGGDPDAKLESYVIETHREKSGNVVSVVVKEGKLQITQEIFSEKAKGKIKGLFDFCNKPVKEINIGEPGKILGFDGLPEIGSLVTDNLIEQKKEDIKNNLKIDKNKIPLYLKANSAGSLEALIASIPQEFAVIDSGVGDLTESDVLNAKANSALIFVFESRISGSVKLLAEMDKVEIYRFEIIYELLQKLDDIIESGMREILGKAEIVTTFPFDGKKVAGSKVITGRIEKTSDLRLLRNEVELGKVKAISIKKQKNEVNVVGQGEEFGIFFSPQLDFRDGDVIVAVKE